MAEDFDAGWDLEIAGIERRTAAGGAWVRGALNGHRFEALVFPERAGSAEFELGGSRIAKLWLRRESDRATVLNFDRGWDVGPQTDDARRIAAFLEAGLAGLVYGAD